MVSFEKLIGIYNAKGSIIGELQYFFGKIIGKAHCALCDITHGKLKEKPLFKECRQNLEIPFELLHLDELNDELKNFMKDAPCVIGLSNNQYSIIINSKELEECSSDVETFTNLLHSKINLP
tara:strand:- start:3214 stop:3579 length:366 start_codon:yes stop_codon:yes gene_type:complete